MGKIKWDALDLLFKCFKDLKAANFYVKAGHLISLNFDDISGRCCIFMQILH